MSTRRQSQTAWALPRLAGAVVLGILFHEPVTSAGEPVFCQSLESREEVEESGGVIAGNVEFIPAVSGHGACFDGESRITYENDLSSMTNGTVSLWFMKSCDDTKGGVMEIGLLSQANSLGIFYNFGNILIFEIRNSDRAYQQAWSLRVLPQNQWLHAAVTWEHVSNGINMQLFVNGEFVRLVRLGGNFALPGTLTIGDTGYYPHVRGRIDELCLWNEVLSDAEIRDLYVDSPLVMVGVGDPPNCVIDARQPSKPDGSEPSGWQRVEISFNGDVSSLTTADFSVSGLGGDGVAPSIGAVEPVDLDTLRITLDDRIKPGGWTVITHEASQAHATLGSLPGDVSSDRWSLPDDISYLIDCLSEHQACEEWQCDVDRSGAWAPADILRVIDLLNGAGEFEEWNERSLPGCSPGCPCGVLPSP